MLYQDHKRDFSIVDNMLEEANRIRDGAKQAQEVLAKLEDKRKQLHDKCRQKHEEFGQIRAQLQELHQLFKDQEKARNYLRDASKTLFVIIPESIRLFDRPTHPGLTHRHRPPRHTHLRSTTSSIMRNSIFRQLETN